MHLNISCKIWYVGLCCMFVPSFFITSFYFILLLPLHRHCYLGCFQPKLIGFFVLLFSFLLLCNYILFTAAEHSISNCFHCIWCFKCCCCEEVWSWSMVSSFSNLQGVGILFKLCWLPGQKIRNSIWTEKGQ